MSNREARYLWVRDGVIADPPPRTVWAQGREWLLNPFPRPHAVGAVHIGSGATDEDLAGFNCYRLVITERDNPPGLNYVATTGELTVDGDTATVRRVDGWRQMTEAEYADKLSEMKAAAAQAIPRDVRQEALVLRAVAEESVAPLLVLVDGVMQELTPAEALAHANALLAAAYQADLVHWGCSIAAATAETLDDAAGAAKPPTVWVQPTGAHDAYGLGALVLHNGSLWQSLVAANVWEPGVASWRNLTAASSTGYPAWVQPTGTHDAYNAGDRVTHNGSDWESTIAANVWEPGVYGWRAL